MSKFRKFRKKPIEISAIQYTGMYTDEIKEFFGQTHHQFDPDKGILIPTLEGVMLAEPFDWIIRGVENEVYPCKPNIFQATYDEVTNATG